MLLIETNKNFSFDHSVGVLVRAYLNGDLQKGNCSACAVGNLIADAMHIELGRVATPEYSRGVLSLRDDSYLVQWVGTHPGWLGELKGCYQHDISFNAQLASTGYSREQLLLLEETFERPSSLSHQERRDLSHAELVYRSLLAVVDALAQIHGVDLVTSERAEASFTRAHAQLSESVA
jgi:hypothetical protein